MPKDNPNMLMKERSLCLARFLQATRRKFLNIMGRLCANEITTFAASDPPEGGKRKPGRLAGLAEMSMLSITGILRQVGILGDLGSRDRVQGPVVPIGRMGQPGLAGEDAEADQVGPAAGLLAELPAEFIQHPAEGDIRPAFF